MSFVRRAALDTTDSIIEARLIAGLCVSDCLELCDITQRTWYRWLQTGAPRWAIRLVLSQRGTLDRFGWKNWEIRRGVLYCNDLHHRYHWEPPQLLLPLYGATDPSLPFVSAGDKVSSLVEKKKRREVDQGLYLPADAVRAAHP